MTTNTKPKKNNNDTSGILNAINNSMAVIEFNVKGEILHANKNFLGALGYSLDEIVGKHHRIFCESDYAGSAAYKEFWKKLNAGKFQSGQYMRLTKAGNPIWIQASYNPVFDSDGNIEKFVKFASDITAEKEKTADYEGKLAAISKSQAVIEFNLDGTIITANENFTATVGYSLDEIVGKHHRIFCTSEYANSLEYRQFWKKLGEGKFDSGQYMRLGKSGEEIWIQASYNPIMNSEGKPFKVVKFATNITEEKLRNAEYEGKLAAISKSQAAIEFNLDGTIITANENFTATVGYSLDEIVGKHHRIFCETEYTKSLEYKEFWKNLGEGKFDAGQYKRLGKSGEEIWIQASYNPILDSNGKPFKVVKYATDITEEKIRNSDFEGKLDAIGKSQAVIEFNLDGTIITANENFTATVGYKLDEIVGKHHRIFCEEKYTKTRDYELFWENLRKGKFSSGQYKRISKTGEEIWIQASYNPILDPNGNAFKVVKFATNITEEKIRSTDHEGQMAAIDKSQAVIEFEPNGTILKANQNFLSVTGYRLEEIVGKHHRMFCDPEYANSLEYKSFWPDLENGKVFSGEFRRISKSGSNIYIQASYNPILDPEGNITKVVKYATDLTKEKEAYNNLVSSFEDAVVYLTDAADSLNSNATKMSENSKSTEAEATQVGTASEEVSAGVQGVASSMEEMNATVKEISQQVNNTSKVSSEADASAKKAKEMISGLKDASQDIGNIIKTISSIAQQTNLLALNATIEAARAGDSGRGFAVVANEVKELAKQTANSTEEITTMVSRIQEISEESALSINNISEVVDKVYSYATSAATATEEQASTTSEVVRLVSESNKAVQNITKNISKVSKASKDTSDLSTVTLESAQKLSEIANNLGKLIQESKKDGSDSNGKNKSTKLSSVA